MEERLNPYKTAPKVYQAMLAHSEAANHSIIEKPLQELVKMRASQINGCAYCLDMHSKDARAAGETEQRLYMLNAWREATVYTDRERAALEWTEVLTTLGHGRVMPDDVYERALKQFTPEELVNLTLVVNVINAWNRMNVAFRVPGGSYQPVVHAKTAG
jgi:AhpD family alkylhydroperoxidase